MKRKSTQWLWQVTSGKRRYVAMLAVLQLLLNLCVICYSLLFRNMIDRAVEQQLSGFFAALGILVAVAALQLLLRALSRWLEEYTRGNVENGVKHWLFSKLNRKTYAGIQQVHTGEWMNRLTSDTVVVADGITQILPYVLGIFVRMVGAFGMILVLEPLFGLLILPAGLIALVVARMLRPGMKRLHGAVQQADGNVRILLQERLDNQLIIRAFAQQERSVELADEQMAAHQPARMKHNKLHDILLAAPGYLVYTVFMIIKIKNYKPTSSIRK